MQVTGLREFQKSLRDADANLPKQLRLVLNEAGQVIIDYAQPRFARKSGAAVGSLKLRSSQRAVRLAYGGRKAPYAPWLDFGGQGRVHGRPGKRPFIAEGRYLYPGLRARADEIQNVMAAGLTRLASEAGMEVT
jgi:hypothetical protein